MKILLDNNYFIEFIFDNINKRLKNIINLLILHNIINFKRKKRDNDNIESAKSSWLLFLTFQCKFSEKFNRLNSEDVRISFYSVIKLREFIKVQKVFLPHEKKSNVVYKICCKDYDANYRVNKKTAEDENSWAQESYSMEHNHTFGHNWWLIGRGPRVWLGKCCNFGWGIPIQKEVGVRNATHQEKDTWLNLQIDFPKSIFQL